MSDLILPGCPEFNLALGSFPPGWQRERDRLSGEFAFVVRPGVGIWEPVGPDALDEYLLGGEYDERLEEIGDDLADDEMPDDDGPHYWDTSPREVEQWMGAAFSQNSAIRASGS